MELLIKIENVQTVRDNLDTFVYIFFNKQV